MDRAVPLCGLLEPAAILHLPEAHAQRRVVQNQPNEKGGHRRATRNEQHTLNNDVEHRFV
jgi:hypothetical protein